MISKKLQNSTLTLELIPTGRFRLKWCLKNFAHFHELLMSTHSAVNGFTHFWPLHSLSPRLSEFSLGLAPLKHPSMGCSGPRWLYFGNESCINRHLSHFNSPCSSMCDETRERESQIAAVLFILITFNSFNLHLGGWKKELTRGTSQWVKMSSSI